MARSAGRRRRGLSAIGLSLLLGALHAGAAPAPPTPAPREPVHAALPANPAPSVALLEFMGDFADDDGTWIDAEDATAAPGKHKDNDGD
jgi:hypothetical protein